MAIALLQPSSVHPVATYLSELRATRPLGRAIDEHSNYASSGFDKDLKPVFGVDLYKEPFDQGAGYGIVERPEVKVLVYRVEDFRRCFAEALKEFFELEAPLESARTNASESKDYYGTYERIRERLSFDEEVLSRASTLPGTCSISTGRR